MSANAAIHNRGAQSQECEFEGKAQVVAAIPGFYQISFHKPCQHNELLALTNRHLIDRTYLPFEAAYWRENVKKVVKDWKFDLQPASYLEVAMSYRGGKRRIYMKARDDLINGLGRKSDGYVRMFIKPDRYPADAVEGKMPRAIQYRNPRFNLQLATYLRPFEHQFYAHPGMGPSGTRVVTKGMNPIDIAKLFIEKSAHFKNPVYISSDHSKFDSTVRVEHLRTEHAQYMRSYPGCGHLHRLLQRQIHNVGFSRNNLSYSMKGSRMSGDYNTGLGNCLLNRIVLESWLSHIKHEIMLDGDDSVVIVEKDDLHRLDEGHFLRMGFETKIEYNSDITQVLYCQKRLVLGDTVACMVRDPIRALSNMCVCLSNIQGNGLLKWLRGVAQCEYYCNNNMPIFRAFGKYCGGPVLLMNETREKMVGVSRKDHTYVERKAFEATWGIDPTEQIRLENVINQHFDSLLILGQPDNFIPNNHNAFKETEEKRLVTASRYGYSALHSGPDASWNEYSTQRLFNGKYALSVTPATPAPPD